MTIVIKILITQETAIVQNTIGQDLETKIISMYAKGITTGDIESHIEEIYSYQVSDSNY